MIQCVCASVHAELLGSLSGSSGADYITPPVSAVSSFPSCTVVGHMEGEDQARQRYANNSFGIP